jgi:transcriptional regulator with XRE-family HTH domain
MGHRIRQERLNRNISQKELADAAGTSLNTVRELEAGETNPTMRVVLGILRALDLLDRFDALFPEPSPSPVQAVKLRKLQRQRASAASSREEDDHEDWTW